MPTIAIIDDTEKWIILTDSYIRNMEGYTVTVKLHNGIEFANWCYHHHNLPDIALVDVEMPKMDGVQLTDFLTEHFPSIKVIALSSYSQTETVEDMLACGAYGYASKLFNIKNLQEAIVSVANGMVYIDPLLGIKSINREQLMSERKNQKHLLDKKGLSAKQKALIALYSTSASQDEIAEVLSVSSKTVENRVRDISKTLEVTSRLELTLKSIRNGYIRVARIFKKDKTQH